ncbi:MAG: hypothetical protein QOH47_436 [Sphingomonadales bacterium]|nr:hypothetical protein [Sphingomonadales bacterium]
MPPRKGFAFDPLVQLANVRNQPVVIIRWRGQGFAAFGHRHRQLGRFGGFCGTGLAERNFPMRTITISLLLIGAGLSACGSSDENLSERNSASYDTSTNMVADPTMNAIENITADAGNSISSGPDTAAPAGTPPTPAATPAVVVAQSHVTPAAVVAQGRVMPVSDPGDRGGTRWSSGRGHRWTAPGWYLAVYSVDGLWLGIAGGPLTQQDCHFTRTIWDPAGDGFEEDGVRYNVLCVRLDRPRA